MRKLIRKLLKHSWGLPPDPHATYCPSPESDGSLRKNWWQAIGHRLSAISGLVLNYKVIFKNSSQSTPYELTVLREKKKKNNTDLDFYNEKMRTLEHKVSLLTGELNKLESCCTKKQSVDCSFNIKKEDSNQLSIISEHFSGLSENIYELATLIEENASKIALEEPGLLSNSGEITQLIKNARKIQNIFSNLEDGQLESINALVNSLEYLIMVVDDTLQIIDINREVKDMRQIPPSKEEKEFLDEVFDGIENISFKKN